jgi:hypothetical protein
MSKIGDVYGMARGWMDHPLLTTKDPFTKREAWCWLIENAAWKEHSRTWRKDRPPISVKRGQLIAAIRVMADEWAWSKDRVDRFVKILKNALMIDVKTETGICLITICNYDDYQLTPGYSKDADKDADKDAGKDADKDADKDNKNKVNKVNKGKNKDNNNTPTPQGEGVQVALIEDLPIQHKEPCWFDSKFWEIFPRKKGKKQAKEAYDAARARGISQTDILAGARAYRREYDADEREEKDRFYKYPQGWLTAERWRDFTERDETEDDSDEMPKGMTPQQHAEWVLRQMGMT